VGGIILHVLLGHGRVQFIAPHDAACLVPAALDAFFFLVVVVAVVGVEVGSSSSSLSS
jgi:hypothetical protein